MPINARNRVQGQVTNIHAGEVVSLVTIQASDHRLVSSVTNDGVNE